MESIKNRSTWLWLGFSGFVSWAITHILDLSGQGALRLWSKILAVVSLGSATVRDLPYREAALNPSSDASVFLTIFVMSAICMFPVFITLRFFVSKLDKLVNHPDLQSDERQKRRLQVQTWSKRMLIAVLLSYVSVTAPLIVFFVEINEAILVRRIFDANRDILAPSLSSKELLTLQARFCSMNSKSDYQQLMTEITAIAKERGVKLRAEIE